MGVTAFCPHLKAEVLVLPYILNVVADSPMHNEILSHREGRAVSRVSNLAGTAEERRTLGFVRQVVGLDCESVRHPVCQSRKWAGQHIFDIQVHVRNWSDKLENAMRIYESAIKETSVTATNGLMTELSYSDPIAQYFITELLAFQKKQFSRPMGLQIRAAELYAAGGLAAVFEAAVDYHEAYYTYHDREGRLINRLVNPFFFLKGFDGHRDTPVELLHVVLLGYMKYLWRDAIHQLKPSDIQTLASRLSSVSGVLVSPVKIDGRHLTRHAQSLIGKHFRQLLPVAGVVLQGLLPSTKILPFLSLARLATLLYQQSVADLQSFLVSRQIIEHELRIRSCRLQVDLRNETRVFMVQIMALTGQWSNKNKFNILVHAPMHIERHGPLPFSMAEVFERNNATMRHESVLSNHQAPSRDIARAFQEKRTFAHLLSGGRYRQEDGTWTVAGSRILQMFNNPQIQQLIGYKPQDVLNVGKFGSIANARDTRILI